MLKTSTNRTLLALLLLPTLAAAQANSDPKPELPVHKETVVVTGTPGPVPLEEADRSVSSIEIGPSPVAYRNWADLLQNDTAIDLRQRAPGVQGDLSIRGSSFGQTLVLVNGLRLNDAQTGHNNLDLPFPFAALDRVEVLHGSGSTLYGSDAVGGAVNFITSKPEASELRFSAAAGNHGTNQQNASAAYVNRGFSELLTMTRELSSGFMYDRDYRNLAFASQSSLRTGLGLANLMLGYSDRPFGASQFYGKYNSWERTKAWFASGSQQIGANTQAVFGYRRHTDIFVLLRDKPQVYKNDHLTDSYQAALRRNDRLAANTRIYYGVEGYRDIIDSSSLGVHTRDRGAVYMDVDFRALKRFSLTLGAREELYSGGNAQFSPSVTGGYWLSSKVKLRASASRAYRLPTYTDLYYRDPANIGNPNLKAETAWNYEGGAQMNIGKAVADVTIFHRRDRNVIDYVRAGIGSPWQATNIQNLNFTGVESSVRWTMGTQRFAASYTGLTGAQETLSGLQSKYVFNYPTNSGTVTWWGKIPGSIDSRVRLGVVQRYQRDAYPLAELVASRQFAHVKPFVQLTNLTNTGYDEIPGVMMPGRAVLVGMELVFSGR